MITSSSGFLQATGNGFFLVQANDKPLYPIMIMPIGSIGYPFQLPPRLEMTNTGNPIGMRMSHIIVDQGTDGERLVFTNKSQIVGGHPVAYRSPITATSTETIIQDAVNLLGNTHSYDIVVYLKVETSPGVFQALPKYRILDWTYRTFNDEWAINDNDPERSGPLDPYGEWQIGLTLNNTTDNLLIPYSYDDGEFIELTRNQFKSRIAPGYHSHLVKQDGMTKTHSTYGELEVIGDNGLYYNPVFTLVYDANRTPQRYYTITQNENNFTDLVSVLSDKSFFYLGFISSHVNIKTLPPTLSLDRNNALMNQLNIDGDRSSVEQATRYFVDNLGNELYQSNADSNDINLVEQAAIDFDTFSKGLIQGI